MFSLISYLVVACLVVFAINKLFDEGMIFEKAGNWIREKAGEYWCKPLICCPPCMASIHGTWFYWAFVQQGPGLWPIFVLALSGLAYLVNKI